MRAVHRVASRRVLDADVRACHQLILTRLDSFGRMNAMSFACCSVSIIVRVLASNRRAAPRRILAISDRPSPTAQTHCPRARAVVTSPLLKTPHRSVPPAVVSAGCSVSRDSNPLGELPDGISLPADLVDVVEQRVRVDPVPRLEEIMDLLGLGSEVSLITSGMIGEVT